MSKMSQLHAELSEQAYELGFESIGEAEQAGYGVDWENAKLIKAEDDVPAWCKRYERYDEEQEKAHEAWLKEREEVVVGLERLITAYAGAEAVTKPVRKAINFIMKGEM